MLNVALHLAVARFEGAELDTGQPQARHRLHVVHQHLWRGLGAAVVQHGLEFLQQLRVFFGDRVGQGFLDLQQHRRAVLAVDAHRAGARGFEQNQCALG
ncbi:hypothetical protein D3C71_1749750 [compost metagenome]